jgi:hypothetical protein
MVHGWLSSLCLAGLAGVVFGGAALAAPPTRAKYLLLDSRIVAGTENAALRVGKPVKHAANPLFAEEHPWEARFDNLYANVLYDEAEKLYKCWYSPFIVDKAVSGTPRARRGEISYMQARRTLKDGRRRVMGVCYATSTDGLKWKKPRMGIHEFGGEKSNLVAVGPHGAGVFRDDREKDPKRRYKMFFKGQGMSVAFSADGLHWSKPRPCREIDVAGDTHNNAFWAPELGRYVGITRTWGGRPRVRQVARTESDDFLQWTKAEVVLQGIQPHLQVYAMPVFRYADVYLGLAMIFRSKEDRTHCELAWSADTIEWHRIDANTPLIGNSKIKGAYDWGCVYAAACPVFRKNEIRLYYGASNGKHTDWRDGFLALATLRPDGFAGYEPEDRRRAALIRTRPILCNGRRLAVSADAKGGSLRAAVRDVPGLGLADCRPVTADVTDAVVKWAGGGDLAALKGRPIRLVFELRSARLYALRFLD